MDGLYVNIMRLQAITIVDEILLYAIYFLAFLPLKFR